MARPWGEKFVQDKVLAFTAQEDCYIYKRPNTSVWQYFISVPNEGEERRSTRIKGSPTDNTIGQVEALAVAKERYYEIKARHQQGLKAKRVKGLFDFIEKFLKQEHDRIATYNVPDKITAETYRTRTLHMKMLRKYFQ